MITRKASFKDFSQLGEILGHTAIAQWLMFETTHNTISLVTIDKKKIIAALLGVYNLNNYQIEVKHFFYPEGKQEIGEFLLNKAAQQFSETKQITMTATKILWDNGDDREIQVS